MRRLAVVLVVGVLVLVAGCDSSGDEVVALDGSPRHPDDEGVVTAISFERITLDGRRSYDVSRKLLAFSTSTRELEPMLLRDGQYVQIGLDGRTMVWMAGVAAVVPTDPPAVYYVGRLVAVEDGRRAVFADGTVLRLAPGVVQRERRRFRARIDPARHVVVELVPA
jgi:hypothetical protein